MEEGKSERRFTSSTDKQIGVRLCRLATAAADNEEEDSHKKSYEVAGHKYVMMFCIIIVVYLLSTATQLQLCTYSSNLLLSVRTFIGLGLNLLLLLSTWSSSLPLCLSY